jgi:hypothetical protein
MLIAILVVALVLALAGWRPAYNYGGYYGGFGWVGSLLVLLLILYVLGVLR